MHESTRSRPAERAEDAPRRLDVRVTPAEHRMLEAAARRDNRSIAAQARHLLVGALYAAEQPGTRRF